MNIKSIIKNIILSPRSFFLENLGVKQTIFKNTFWLAFAEGITRFLKLILIIYVARIFGATEYGKFNFALAFVGLFMIFSDLGISQIATREIARENQKEKEFPAILSLKFLLSLGTLALILIGSFFITPDPVIRGVIWILAIYIIVSGFSGIIFAFFQARQRMEYESWAKILQALVVTAAGFFVILNFPSVKNLSYSYLFASLTALVFILLFFHFKVYHLCLSWNKSIWKRFLSLSWPIALTGITGLAYGQIDSTMMGYWNQITQTGWYNAAFRILGVTFIPLALISQSFYPTLSSFLKKPKEKLQRVWNYYLEIMVSLAVPMVTGGLILAPRIIDFVYDPTFFPAILAFQILIIITGISYLSIPIGQVLVIFNQQKKVFWFGLAAASVNIILNLILIPKYSLYGAAFASVASLCLYLFLLLKYTTKLTTIKPLNARFFLNLGSSILACIPMYFIIIQPTIYQLNVFISIFIGATVYFFTLVILKLPKYFVIKT